MYSAAIFILTKVWNQLQQMDDENHDIHKSFYDHTRMKLYHCWMDAAKDHVKQIKSNRKR